MRDDYPVGRGTQTLTLACCYYSSRGNKTKKEGLEGNVEQRKQIKKPQPRFPFPEGSLMAKRFREIIEYIGI